MSEQDWEKQKRCYPGTLPPMLCSELRARRSLRARQNHHLLPATEHRAVRCAYLFVCFSKENSVSAGLLNVDCQIRSTYTESSTPTFKGTKRRAPGERVRCPVAGEEEGGRHRKAGGVPAEAPHGLSNLSRAVPRACRTKHVVLVLHSWRPRGQVGIASSQGPHLGSWVVPDEWAKSWLFCPQLWSKVLLRVGVTLEEFLEAATICQSRSESINLFLPGEG